jgi:hypothetical protein
LAVWLRPPFDDTQPTTLATRLSCRSDDRTNITRHTAHRTHTDTHRRATSRYTSSGSTLHNNQRQVATLQATIRYIVRCKPFHFERQFAVWKIDSLNTLSYAMRPGPLRHTFNPCDLSPPTPHRRGFFLKRSVILSCFNRLFGLSWRTMGIAGASTPVKEPFNNWSGPIFLFKMLMKR